MDHVPVHGVVLFDGSCGFCRWWIPFWGPALERRGFGVARLQAEWVRLHLNVSDAELLADLRLLLADGRMIRGADVYRFVMRRIWWAYPLYLLSIAPGCRAVFDWGYRTFADNRFWISQACQMSANK